jgi:hypothetical protein
MKYYESFFLNLTMKSFFKNYYWNSNLKNKLKIWRLSVELDKVLVCVLCVWEIVMT